MQETCTVIAVVGNHENIESNQAVFTYNIINPLSPTVQSFTVMEGVETPLIIPMEAPNQASYTGEVLFFYTLYPSHGGLVGNNPCLFTSMPDYFSIPANDVYNTPLYKSKDTIRLYALHRGIATNDFPVTINIQNVNTAPQYVD